MPHAVAKGHTSNEEENNTRPDARHSVQGSVSIHLASETSVPKHHPNGCEHSDTSNKMNVNTVTPTIARDESVKHGTDGYSSSISYHPNLSGGSDFVCQGESEFKSRKRQAAEDDNNESLEQTKRNVSNGNSSHLLQSMESSIPYTPTTQTQSYPRNHQQLPWRMQPVNMSTPYSNFIGATIPGTFPMIPFTPNQVPSSAYMSAQASQMDHRYPPIPVVHGANEYQNYYGSTPNQTDRGAVYLQRDKDGESHLPPSAKKYKTWNNEKYQGENTQNENLSKQEQSSSSLHKDPVYSHDATNDHSSRRMYILPSPVQQHRNYTNTTEQINRNPMEETPSHIKQFDNMYNISPMANTSTTKVDLKASKANSSAKSMLKEDDTVESERFKKITPKRNRKLPQRYIQDNFSEEGLESIRKQTNGRKDDQVARKEKGSAIVAPLVLQSSRPPSHIVENAVVERIRAQRASFIEGQANLVCTKLLPSEVAQYNALPRNELMELLSRSEAISLPHFSSLTNYTPSTKSKRISTFRECVMCGILRPANVPKKGASVNVPIIPVQNKGLCTDCDVGVWMLNDTFTEIKWCKGCKNFKKWIDFGGKLTATKCESCRERQREKYREKCENREKESMERALMYQKVKHKIRNTENNDHSGLDCLLAAASTQMGGENG